MEDADSRQRLSFSLFELGYGLWELFNWTQKSLAYEKLNELELSRWSFQQCKFIHLLSDWNTQTNSTDIRLEMHPG